MAVSGDAHQRIYARAESVVFLKTREAFGGLSNMAGGYPLLINGVRIPSSEALYQACRFPHLPDLQRLIIGQASPMTAKMVGKPYREQTRADWDTVRVPIMRWCLRVKLALHWERFAELLRSTGDRPIVEESRRDPFWGALPISPEELVGVNALGRLLMQLREWLHTRESALLLVVEPLQIADFLLLSQPIGVVTAPGYQLVRPAPAQTALPLDAPPPDMRTPEQRRFDELMNEPFAPDDGARRSSAPIRVPAHLMQPDPLDVEEYPVSTSAAYPRRLIEVDLPIKRISAHARREKSIRHGHISTLHIWWARRPLAACRAVVCAALWPDPADELCPPAFRRAAAHVLAEFAERVRTDAALADLCSASWSRWKRTTAASLRADDPACWPEMRYALLDFIADFANWDASTVPAFLEASRALTQAAHEALGGIPGTRPLVVDPFAGGGSIPLEALRVGADAFASDLNPVAVLLNKVVLEYIPKYGQRLADEVRKWGQWVKEQAEKELAEFYPKDPDGATPIAYLWARTITCEGPGCGAEVPLIRSLWLAKKGERSVALRLVPNPAQKRVDFEIIHQAKPKDVADGTVKRGSATCPCCGYTIPVASVRQQLKMRHGGTDDARLFCIVTSTSQVKGRYYRLPIPQDLKTLDAAKKEIKGRKNLNNDDISIIPDEKTKDYHTFVNRGPIYGLDVWSDYFNPRQLLTLSTLANLVRKVGEILESDGDLEFASVVQTTLALAIGRLADRCSTLCTWDPSPAASGILHTFARQALPFVWDFAEGVPLEPKSGGWLPSLEWIALVIEREAKNFYGRNKGTVYQASATYHPLPDDASQVLITDPPYYFSVQYADLADFFYVWLRRILYHRHPNLFVNPVIFKDDEIIVQSPGHEFAAEGKNNAFYESHMRIAMSQGRRFLIPSGIGVVVFAHTSTFGWEAQLQSMIDAGWTITGSWPIDTEMANRVLARGRSVLASSIHLVCRPRENANGTLAELVGDWRDVLQELPGRIHAWMPRLAAEGVVGADAIFACLGPALEIFSRYSRVEKASGEQVTLREYLEHVWAAVAREALSMLFSGADASGLEADARLTAMWLWTLSTSDQRPVEAANEEDETGEDEDESGKKSGAGKGGFSLEFDAARKIAQGLGADLAALGSVVEVKGETARLRAVAERTRHLFGKDEAMAPSSRRAKASPQLSMFAELNQAEEADGWGEKSAPPAGHTVLDRVHQAMILFAAGRSEALKRFLVEQGTGTDGRFWSLAQSLSALYPPGTDEKRWVDGVLARKKGLGF